MSEKFFTMLFSTLFAVILLSSCKESPQPFECADSIGCVRIAPEEPVKLGVLQALSGKIAPLGTEQIRGIELAVADRKGRVLEHLVELHKEDSRCTSEGGIMAAIKITTDPGIVAVFGTTCSGAAATASKVISEAGLVMISGNNSAPSLTSLNGKQGSDWYPGYFRTSFNDGIAGQAAAIFAFQELGLHKAAAVNDGDVYTRGLTDGFTQAFEKLGGKIVLHTSVNKGDTDMKPVLSAVAESQAELLFFPLFQPEGELIVLQAKEIAGLKNTILMGNGALLVNTFIESVKSDGKGMYFIGPAPKNLNNNKLTAEYKSKYGEPPQTNYYTYAYDAASLLMNAVESVAVKEKDGSLHIGRQALRDALNATENFKGLTGRISCDKFGDCGSSRFNIMRLDDPAAGFKGLISNVIYTYTPEE
ncbi:MAG: ABC transporter substrate-binding protein [Desulfobacterales bacterium]|nr:ABC transporter substrate-binding protein [Desulfobacterales bacterium]